MSEQKKDMKLVITLHPDGALEVAMENVSSLESYGLLKLAESALLTGNRNDESERFFDDMDWEVKGEQRTESNCHVQGD